MRNDYFEYLAKMFNERIITGINDGWSDIDNTVKQFVKEYCENFKMEPLDGCDSS